MRPVRVACVVTLGLVVCVAHVHGQAVETSDSVPRLINLSGTFHPADGQPPSPVETVRLALYSDEAGGSPLWEETQTIQMRTDGRYTIVLGQTQRDGVPLQVFASGEARWLGMLWARPGETEGSRARITSVPYALKASDADTLGGHPASAYLLAPSNATGEGHSTATASSATTRTSASGASSVPTATTQAILTGTPNFLAKYASTTDVGPSALFESAGSVGLGTTTPLDLFHVRFTNTTGSFTGLAVQNLGNTATSYSGMLFYDQNGALGQFQGFNNVTHEYRINNVAAAGSINFLIGGSSKFQVANNGNIVTNGQMTVLNSALNGLRVATGVAGGYVGSFGGVGEFDVDAPFITGGRLAVKESGNVGIGIPAPGQKLSVAGTVESTTGGFKFPDGSVQSTAANVVFVDFPQTIPAFPDTLPGLAVFHLDVPNGTYFVEASMNLSNANNAFGSNNSRTIQCQFPQSPSGYSYELDIAGDSNAVLSVHAIATVAAGVIELQCSVIQSGVPTFVGAHGRQLTAVRIGDSVVIQTGG